MEKFPKSSKLDHVCYDIRGPVHKKALQLEEEGNKILKLNIGNPAPFGFEAPDEILVDVIRNLPTAQGYCDSKGLYSARKAIVHYYQTKGLLDVTVNDVYIGNGVSELITMSMQALLNDGDEILIPAPDYPLWTAAATLAGGNVRHYLCDEENDWFPNLADIEAKITPKTKSHRRHQPQQPYRRGVQQRNPARNRRVGAQTRSDHLRRRNLRQNPLRRSGTPPHRRTRARPTDHHLQRPLQSLPRCRISPRLDGAQRSERTCQRLYRRPRYALVHAPMRQHAPCNTPSKPLWAAIKASTNSSCPAAACWSSAIKRGNLSTKFPAYPASSRWGTLYVPKSTPKCTVSMTT